MLPEILWNWKEKSLQGYICPLKLFLILYSKVLHWNLSESDYSLFFEVCWQKFPIFLNFESHQIEYIYFQNKPQKLLLQSHHNFLSSEVGRHQNLNRQNFHPLKEEKKKLICLLFLPLWLPLLNHYLNTFLFTILILVQKIQSVN